MASHCVTLVGAHSNVGSSPTPATVAARRCLGCDPGNCGFDSHQPPYQPGPRQGIEALTLDRIGSAPILATIRRVDQLADRVLWEHEGARAELATPTGRDSKDCYPSLKAMSRCKSYSGPFWSGSINKAS
jgi:hypothetical protein